MNGNPYGAVPEALKETRLTLRDLMADHLANKVAEGRLSLAKTQAETETAMVGANLKKEEMVNLRDMAHLTQQRNLAEEDRAARAGEFTKTTGLQERGLELQTKTQEDANKIAQAHIRIAETAEARAGREEARKNEVKTTSEWAQAAGISPDLLGFLGLDGKQKLRRQDAEHLHGTVQAMFKSNPSLGFMANGYAMRGDLTRMQEQLKDPNLPPAQAAELRTKYAATLSKFETLDQLIMAEKQPDQAKIVETARKTWSEDPTMATKYKNFDEFLQEFHKDVKNVRGVFQEDIKKLKTAGTAPPAKITPADVMDMQNLSAVFSKGTEKWQKTTWSNAQDMIRRGKPAQALQYLRKMQETLGQPNATGRTASGADRSFGDPNLVDFGPHQ